MGNNATRKNKKSRYGGSATSKIITPLTNKKIEPYFLNRHLKEIIQFEKDITNGEIKIEVPKNKTRIKKMLKKAWEYAPHQGNSNSKRDIRFSEDYLNKAKQIARNPNIVDANKIITETEASIDKSYSFERPNFYKGEECSICAENIKDKEMTTTNCGHKFHRNCLAKWNIQQEKLGRVENCPLCRAPIK